MSGVRGDGSREERKREVWWGKVQREKEAKRDRETETESKSQIGII